MKSRISASFPTCKMWLKAKIYPKQKLIGCFSQLIVRTWRSECSSKFASRCAVSTRSCTTDPPSCKMPALGTRANWLFCTTRFHCIRLASWEPFQQLWHQTDWVDGAWCCEVCLSSCWRWLCSVFRWRCKTRRQNLQALLWVCLAFVCFCLPSKLEWVRCLGLYAAKFFLRKLRESRTVSLPRPISLQTIASALHF